MKYITHIPTKAELAHRLFDTITTRVKVPCDSVLVHITSWTELMNLDLRNDFLFIALEDSPHYGQFPIGEYDYWGPCQEPSIFQDIRRLATSRPDRQIVLMLQGNHYHDGYFNLPNVTVGKWFTTPENDLYSQLKPVVEKNPKSDKIGIALNRQMRTHRLALCSLLYGMDLDTVCHISSGHLYKQIDKLPSREFLDHNPWQYDQHNDHVKNIMCRGFEKMIWDTANLSFGNNDGNDIYQLHPGTDTVLYFDNISNFENNLRPLYMQSYVEIVSNRLFCEPSINIDEKFINTIYARNFPILISSAGTADLYRSFGFDLFDDVVDHSYDEIKNPIDRLWAAVEKNKHLMLDPDTTIQTWNRVQDRFEANISYAREKFYRKLENMTLRECNRCMENFLSFPFDIK